jgi:hypothetical protein
MDIFAKSNSAGFCVFDYIDRIGATKYQLADTSNDSLTPPSRPAAPKSQILNSIFYGVDQLKYSDYVLHTMSTSKSKKSKGLNRKEKIERNKSKYLLRMINLRSQFFRLFLTLVLKEKNKKWTQDSNKGNEGNKKNKEKNGNDEIQKISTSKENH